MLAAGLTWAGTFHAIGARLLREHAPALGLDPAFTIHDREDSDDLMDLVRHRLGLLAHRAPVSRPRATCLAIYSRAVNAREPLGDGARARLPLVRRLGGRAAALFAAYVAAKQAAHVLDYDDLLLYWAEMLAEPAAAAELGARFDHVLVDEYQDTNRLQAEILAGAEAGRPRRDRGRRRRAGDLRLPGGGGAQHPRLPRPLRAAGARRDARAQLPLDARRSSRRRTR